MAALLISVGPLPCHCTRESVPILGDPRMFTRVSCRNRDPTNKQGKGFRITLKKVWGGVEKLGDNLRPKHKGDWKDVTLMSLSFAVYVYMSQKLVCAYCAWMSMAGAVHR